MQQYAENNNVIINCIPYIISEQTLKDDFKTVPELLRKTGIAKFLVSPFIKFTILVMKQTLKDAKVGPNLCPTGHFRQLVKD